MLLSDVLSHSHGALLAILYTYVRVGPMSNYTTTTTTLEKKRKDDTKGWSRKVFFRKKISNQRLAFKSGVRWTISMRDNVGKVLVSSWTTLDHIVSTEEAGALAW
jgi:hypothetical protein